MPEDTNENSKGTCFVIMGFGVRPDHETNRIIDLDKSYQYIIKPAVEDAGLKCIRADEIQHSGNIDEHMFQQLLSADVVVADLSTSNNNAFYELGVRHALRPYTTVVIAEKGIKKIPFDLDHVVIRRYEHMGLGIDHGEVLRFKFELTTAIRDIINQATRELDSPVYTFIKNLEPPFIRKNPV